VITLRRRFALLLVLVTLLGLAVTAGTPAARAAEQTLPPGFVLRDIATGLLPPNGADPGDLVTDFAYLPDESLVVTGKYGKVMWVPRTGAPRQLAALPTNGAGDLGLTGLAVAPDYATSRAVYTARAVPDTGPGSGANGVLRLSRWTVALGGDGKPSALTGEQTVFQTSADFSVHGITGVVAAADGTVWVSIGDAADYRNVDPLALRAQDVDDPHGKLLHLKVNGDGVATNPYYSASTPRAARSLVYASGFRSPFRFSIEADTGRPVLGDVGAGKWEEVDLIAPGNNYGWPCWEANTQMAGFKDLPECAGKTTASPLWTYPHVGSSSVTGGVAYTGTSYPQQYRGRYFFGDYVHHNMFSMAYDAQGKLTTPPEQNGFGTEIGSPVKFATVPTGGDLVFADIGGARLRQLVYAPGNEPPNAVITSTADPATRTVTFDATSTRDPNGDVPAYHWTFGDGTTADGPRITHAYAAGAESFAVTLTATDPQGAAGTAQATVFPGNHAPALSLQPPDPARTFAVGDVITADATATDAEDGPVQIRWAAVVIHCADAATCHQHPGEQQQGPQFRQTFEGHPGDSRLEITAIATDSRGAATTQTFTVHPKQRRVTIQSTAEAGFTIGDEQTSSGLFTVGTPLTIIAPAQALDGVATFDKWGDGNTGRVRQLTLPDADQTISVTYGTPIDRRYAADAALRAVLGSPTDVEQGDATVRWRAYTGGRMYWSPATAAHAMRGGILARYLALGGHLKYGLPVTDEEVGGDGKGRYTLLYGYQSLYWSPGQPVHMVNGEIYKRYKAMGADRSALGYPVTDEAGPANGRFSKFQRGSIYWTPAHGAHDVIGGIRDRWTALGGVNGLGYPTTNEADTGNRLGRFNHFERGSVFWSSPTGAWGISGAIRNKWASLGWDSSYLGFPTGGEFAVSGGRRQNFQHGYIVYQAGRATDHRY
jgi:glucose/arabinose dehydrogenase